jgi:hypothetical protein
LMRLPRSRRRHLPLWLRMSDGFTLTWHDTTWTIIFVNIMTLMIFRERISGHIPHVSFHLEEWLNESYFFWSIFVLSEAVQLVNLENGGGNQSCRVAPRKSVIKQRRAHRFICHVRSDRVHLFGHRGNQIPCGVADDDDVF